jgi:hypothetical protein
MYDNNYIMLNRGYIKHVRNLLQIEGTGKLKVSNEIIPTCLPQATALPHSLNALILRSR